MTPASDRLVELAWTQAWQVAAVAIAVAVVARLACRTRPHLAYLLWMLVIVKALTPPVWSSPTGLFSWATAITTHTIIARAEPPRPLPPLEATAAEAPPGETPAADLPPVVARSGVPYVHLPPRAPSASSLSVAHVLLSLWAISALALLAIVVARWLGLVRLVRRTSQPVDPAIERQFAELHAKIGPRRPARLVLTSAPLGPAAFGWWRGTVVVPLALVRDKTPAELAQIFAHELVHLRRYDTVAGHLQLAAQLVWWFHPAVWWANRQARVERERACDEEVVAELGCPPADYARLLVDVLRWRHHLTPALPWPGMRAWDVTAARLQYMLHPARAFRRRAPAACWIVVALALILVLPGAGLERFTTSAEEPLAQPAVVAAEPRTKVDLAASLSAEQHAAMKELEKLGVGFYGFEERPFGGKPGLMASFNHSFQTADKPLPLGELPIEGFSVRADSPDQLRARLRALRELKPATELIVTYSRKNVAGLDALADIPRLAALVLVPDVEAPPLPVRIDHLNSLRKLVWYEVPKDQLAQVAELSKLESLTITLAGDISDANLVPLAGLTRLTQLMLGAGRDGKRPYVLDLVLLDTMPSMADLSVFAGCTPSDAAAGRIGKLDKLWRLRVDLSGASDAALAEIAKVKNLRVLDVFNSFAAPRLTSAGLARLKKLTNLTKLSIQSAPQPAPQLAITDESVATWPALDKLRELTLSPCQLSDPGLEAIGKLESLTSLTLLGQVIPSDRGLAALGKLPALDELTVTGFDWSDASLDHLLNSRLSKLALTPASGVTDEGLKKLAGISDIRSISLTSSKITGSGAVALAPPARKLRALALRNGKVNDAGLRTIATLSDLGELDLSGNPLSDGGLAAFRGHLPALEKLTLDDTPLTDHGLAALLGRQRLRELHVTGTELSEAGRKKLEAAAPRLQVMTQSWATFTITDDDDHRPAAETRGKPSGSGQSGVTPSPGQPATRWVGNLPPDEGAVLSELETRGIQIQLVDYSSMMSWAWSGRGQLVFGDALEIPKGQLVTAAGAVLPADFQPGDQPLPLEKLTRLVNVQVGVDSQSFLGLQGPIRQPTEQQLRAQLLALRQLLPTTTLNVVYTDDNIGALDALAAIPRLQRLALWPDAGPRKAQLESRGKIGFDRLTNLRALAWMADALAPLELDSHLPAIASLTNLERLVLQGSMSEPALDHLKTLRQVRVLCLGQLDEKQFNTPVQLACLEGMPFVEELIAGRLGNDAGARIGRLARLRTLSADIGGLNDDGLRQIASANQLRSLNVSIMHGPVQSSSAGLRALGTLASLERLRIGGYGAQGIASHLVTDESVAGWHGLRKLRTLDLGTCRLSDAGLKSLGQLDTLTQLRLGGELDISDEGLAALGRHVRLKRLMLPQVGITGIAFAQFEAAALQALSIKNSPITYEGAEQIARFSNLRELDLSGCTIGDRELKLLVKNLSKLERLGLALTAVSDESLVDLLDHKTLRELDVSGTKLTVALMGRLLEHNGQLRIWAADATAPQSARGSIGGSFQPIEIE